MKKNFYFLKNRFRKFYPVIIDIETSGLNHTIHAILEIAVITLTMNNNGFLKIKNIIHFHIQPFTGSYLKKQALIFNKIDPFNIIRQPVQEKKALQYIFDIIKKEIKNHECSKSVIVAHNATFDHNFIMQISKRNKIEHPFHPFVIFDTATLSGLILGQTVLSKACQSIGIKFNNKKAHSAIYDAKKTAYLFCELSNNYKKYSVRKSYN